MEGKMPLPRVEGRSSGDERQSELKSQPTFTVPAAHTQASTLGLTPALLIEWWVELERRLTRAELLLSLGLPDVGFHLLVEEVHGFNQACRAVSLGRAA
jgi:hypothetical protein